MKKITTGLAFTALCCASLFAAVAPAAALPHTGALRLISDSNSEAKLLQSAQYRGRSSRRRSSRRNRRGRSGNNFGRNATIGLGAAIIGGLVLSEAARAEHRRSHGGAWERCARTYRSFEHDTGMYTGYDGIRHTCPYLR